jgi:hypothetical protein
MNTPSEQTARPPTSIRIISAFFQIVWYLSWVAVVLSVALLVTVGVSDFRVKYIRLPIEVDYRNTEVTPSFAGATTPSGLPLKGFRTIYVDGSEAPGQGYALLIPLALAVGLLWVITQLRRFIGTVKRGTPFTPENPRTLRRIGYAVFAAGPVVGLLSYIYGSAYQHLVDFPDAVVKVPFDAHPFVMFLGLVILVIAQVFDYGVKLQAEQDLTV